MSLQICSGVKHARHAEIMYDSGGNFCPACEALERVSALEEEIRELNGSLSLAEQARREMSARIDGLHIVERV